MVLFLFEGAQESSDSRPRLRDDFGYEINVNLGSPTDVTVGDKFVEPG